MNRRSVYLAQSRTRPVGFLHAFDMPTMNQGETTERKGAGTSDEPNELTIDEGRSKERSLPAARRSLRLIRCAQTEWIWSLVQRADQVRTLAPVSPNRERTALHVRPTPG